MTAKESEMADGRIVNDAEGSVRSTPPN